MAIPSRSTIPGTFFVTSATWERRRIFQVSENAELFMETLQHYRRLGHFKLHAFVVMPDHVHLLLTPGELALERVVGLIKGGFSHKVGSKSPVWQRGFSDRRMRDRAEFEIRRDYIHQNPVRAKLLKQMRDYPFSSAHGADVNAAYLRG